MVNDPTIKHANYLLQKFTNRVADQYPDPVFKVRSDLENIIESGFKAMVGSESAFRKMVGSRSGLNIQDY